MGLFAWFTPPSLAGGAAVPQLRAAQSHLLQQPGAGEHTALELHK